MLIFTSSKFNKASLKAFFEKKMLANIDELSLYFALLQKELGFIFFSNKPVKTSVSVEIDQCGSGPMLVAILTTGNRKLAEKCNLLPGETQCMYSYIMGECKNYLFVETPELVSDAPLAVEFLCTHRKSQKKSFNVLHWKPTAFK